jgi:putative membrane protein
MILATVTPQVLWDWHYHPDPGIIDGIASMTVLYALGVGPARRWLAPEEKIRPLQIFCFALAQLILLFAVASPLDEISDSYLFCAHMFQHVLLIYPIAFLWLLGTPAWILRIPFSMEWSAPLARFLVRPAIAFIVFNSLLYIWHMPGLYEWALRDSKIHFLEHAAFLGSAVLMWWPLMRPLPEMPRLAYGGQLLYLIAGSIALMPLTGILVFGHEPLYPTYRAAARVTELTPLADQQLGAVIMKLTAMVVMFIAMTIVFFRWYSEEQSPNFGRRKPRANLASEVSPALITNESV